MPSCLLPVPTSNKGIKQRGYNQAALIARELGRLTGIPVIENRLIKTRETTKQAAADRAERHLNLIHAFTCKPFAEPPELIGLVDDVITTGSTLEACAEALKSAGVKQVIVLALAKTPA